jgi:hypothetical protein
MLIIACKFGISINIRPIISTTTIELEPVILNYQLVGII